MRVMVAMSGGVDSSVVAALLKAEGHEVVGATLQLYDHGQATRKGACCAGRDILDARAVADQLDFPHYVINAEDRFRKSVIDTFAESYARGETPVPCVACNQGVKFTDLLSLAQELGCGAMATGHYVRRLEGADRPELHRPVDADRDQSWFLFATTQAQLDFLRFPLGEYRSKAEVREKAAAFGLRIAAKADSQDICFVTDGSYATMVESLRPEIKGPGDITDESGRIVGRHNGIAHYTVGQSKKLGDIHTRDGARHMVTRIDAAHRRIVVTPRAQAGRTQFELRDVNWLTAVPTDGLACEVQLRAREVTRAARVYRKADGGADVVLANAAMPAPGQACVFYHESRVLGGGFICADSK